MLGRYLKDTVYGANDGIITTFAIVAGVSGADLSALTVIILGSANLLADGFSMAASNWLGSKSEEDFLRGNNSQEARKMKILLTRDKNTSSLITFASFVVAGSVPIMPFLFLSEKTNPFFYATLATAAVLFIVGSLRARLTRRSYIASGLEMLIIGGIAAGIAYGVGFLLTGLALV